MEEIRKKIEENRKAIIAARMVLGSDCFTKEAEIKAKALDALWKSEAYAITKEEFVDAVEMAEANEEVRTQMERYMKHALGIEIK